jgi:hypothetical protein
MTVGSIWVKLRRSLIITTAVIWYQAPLILQQPTVVSGVDTVLWTYGENHFHEALRDIPLKGFYMLHNISRN